MIFSKRMKSGRGRNTVTREETIYGHTERMVIYEI